MQLKALFFLENIANRNLILGILLLVATSMGLAQERYVTAVFSDISKETYTYSDTLKLDFYSSETDTVVKKPLLVFVHGGGFATGKRDNVLERTFSEKMAQKGYAVAAISYRLTRKGMSFSCDCPAEEKMETFLAVSEDVLKATQYLVNKSAELNIDKNKIVLIGSSAGAEAVLNTAFMQHQHHFRKLPYESIKFSAVISFAGAVFDAGYITQNNAVPTLLFHGEKDKLVPFGTAPHHYCEESALGFLILDGSQTIAQRLEALNISYTLAFDPEGNHDWANIPFTYTDMIASFIKKNSIDGELQQAKIKVSRKE